MGSRYEQERERLEKLPRAERFAALIEFPARHTFKIIGQSQGLSIQVKKTLEALGYLKVIMVERQSSGQKYLSLTFTLAVESGVELDAVYTALEKTAGLLYLL